MHGGGSRTAGITSPRTNCVDRARAHRPEAIVSSSPDERVERHRVSRTPRQYVDCLYSAEHVIVVYELILHHSGRPRKIGQIENPVAFVPADGPWRCLEVRARFARSVAHRNDEMDYTAVGASLDVHIDIEQTSHAVTRLD